MILYLHTPETQYVISSETAYVTIKPLQGVSKSVSASPLLPEGITDIAYESAGTVSTYQFKIPIAGKTGTTQNNSDCGLMGMVRILVTGVWVGGEDRSVHFESTMYGQGATMALPVWALYMKDCYNDERLTISKEEFTVPPNLTIEVDCDKWKEEGKPEDIEEVPDEFDF